MSCIGVLVDEKECPIVDFDLNLRHAGRQEVGWNDSQTNTG